jgi:hypothetical protein
MFLASATIIRRTNILIEMNIVSKCNAFMILFMSCDPSLLFCLLVAQHAHATQFRKRLPKSEIDIRPPFFDSLVAQYFTRSPTH